MICVICFFFFSRLKDYPEMIRIRVGSVVVVSVVDMIYQDHHSGN